MLRHTGNVIYTQQKDSVLGKRIIYNRKNDKNGKYISHFNELCAIYKSLQKHLAQVF